MWLTDSISDTKWEARLTLQRTPNPEDDRQEDWQLSVNARQAVNKTRHLFCIRFHWFKCLKKKPRINLLASLYRPDPQGLYPDGVW